MICSKCGNNCNEGDVLCPNCGYTLDQTSNNQTNNGVIPNNGMVQNVNYNNIPNNGQYQNMSNNYNIPYNGQYQKYNFSTVPNRKVKSSAGLIVGIVLAVIVVIIIVGVIVLFPLIKSLLKNASIRGEWYCSENIATANEEEASMHVFMNLDGTFSWKQIGDEDNNYFSGTYTINGIEIKTGDENYTDYDIKMDIDEAKIDGVISNQYENKFNNVDVVVSRNESDEKLHATFTSENNMNKIYCVKKEK